MRYIIGVLIGILLIVLLFMGIFRHSGGPAPAPTGNGKLVDYANTSTVVDFTDDYPVNVDQNHNVVTTTVGRDQINTTVNQGYQGTVLRSQSYNNNPTAYASFLGALQTAGFTNSKDDPKLRDERGFCPLGHRYIFEIKDGSHVIQHIWSSSCGNIGTFKGTVSNVLELFRRQVPDYGKLTTDLESNF